MTLDLFSALIGAIMGGLAVALGFAAFELRAYHDHIGFLQAIALDRADSWESALEDDDDEEGWEEEPPLPSPAPAVSASAAPAAPASAPARTRARRGPAKPAAKPAANPTT